MTNETLSATRTVPAPVETVFSVLTDPASHAAIDGTGWVREPLDGDQLSRMGQIFRMAMYHDRHPERGYQMANKVVVFDPPHAIAWAPGQDRDGELQFGGWVWRYDLARIGESETEVTLIYDWSAVPAFLRDQIQFPPFRPDHLSNSLKNLAELAESPAR